MASHSKSLLLLGFLFAAALLVSSDASARELAESVEESAWYKHGFHWGWKSKPKLGHGPHGLGVHGRRLLSEEEIAATTDNFKGPKFEGHPGGFEHVKGPYYKSKPKPKPGHGPHGLGESGRRLLSEKEHTATTDNFKGPKFEGHPGGFEHGKGPYYKPKPKPKPGHGPHGLGEHGRRLLSEDESATTTDNYKGPKFEGHHGGFEHGKGPYYKPKPGHGPHGLGEHGRRLLSEEEDAATTDNFKGPKFEGHPGGFEHGKGSYYKPKPKPKPGHGPHGLGEHGRRLLSEEEDAATTDNFKGPKFEGHRGGIEHGKGPYYKPKPKPKPGHGPHGLGEHGRRLLSEEEDVATTDNFKGPKFEGQHGGFEHGKGPYYKPKPKPKPGHGPHGLGEHGRRLLSEEEVVATTDNFKGPKFQGHPGGFEHGKGSYYKPKPKPKPGHGPHGLGEHGRRLLNKEEVAPSTYGFKGKGYEHGGYEHEHGGHWHHSPPK